MAPLPGTEIVKFSRKLFLSTSDFEIFFSHLLSAYMQNSSPTQVHENPSAEESSESPHFWVPPPSPNNSITSRSLSQTLSENSESFGSNMSVQGSVGAGEDEIPYLPMKDLLFPERTVTHGCILLPYNAVSSTFVMV